MIGQFNAKNQEKKDSDQETEKPINGSENKGTIWHTAKVSFMDFYQTAAEPVTCS